MTTNRRGRWLLVVLAVVALGVAAPLVSAHGNETADDDHPRDGADADWVTWMRGHMTDQMGPGAVEWMETHVGPHGSGWGPGMADSDQRGSHSRGPGYGGGYGQDGGYGHHGGYGHSDGYSRGPRC